MRALLDINVLIALLDADHVGHGRATAWLASDPERTWASCPLTQNGCARIMSQPSYPNPVSPAAIIERLTEATSHSAHEFWPDDISLLDSRSFRHSRLLGPKQLTDVYLLGLATRRGGTFATTDTRIAIDAVVGASKANLTLV